MEGEGEGGGERERERGNREKRNEKREAYIPSSTRLGVVGVAWRKLVLILASWSSSPALEMSYGLRKLCEVTPSSSWVEPMAKLIPSPRLTLHKRTHS